MVVPIVQYNPETMDTNLPNLFLAGGVIAGRDTAPIFIENLRYQGDVFVRTLKGRL